MNIMKSKVKLPKAAQDLQKLSLSIGDFIRYWGFRRIHGAIWAQLYLSKTPLSCTDLTLKLGLSKALISPALDELCQYQLIYEAPAPNEKTKIYQATEDINKVIKNILRTRESTILKNITRDFSAFSKAASTCDEINEDHLKVLEEMIFSANLMLELMLSHNDIMKLSKDVGS
jgi:DNA-binding transcriptional regulator GbsR (MarR family)